jgi:hypothetical protein
MASALILAPEIGSSSLHNRLSGIDRSRGPNHELFKCYIKLYIPIFSLLLIYIILLPGALEKI